MVETSPRGDQDALWDGYLVPNSWSDQTGVERVRDQHDHSHVGRSWAVSQVRWGLKTQLGQSPPRGSRGVGVPCPCEHLGRPQPSPGVMRSRQAVTSLPPTNTIKALGTLSLTSVLKLRWEPAWPGRPGDGESAQGSESWVRGPEASRGL